MAANPEIVEQLQLIRDQRKGIVQSQQRMYDRDKALFEKHALSEEGLDKAAIALLEAQVKLAEAEIALLKEQPSKAASKKSPKS